MPDLIIKFLQPSQLTLKENLSSHIKKIIGINTQTEHTLINILEFFDAEREQYNAVQIIEFFADEGDKKTILITDVDIYIPIFTFVFGLAKLNGNTGIVSTHRLNNIYYGLPEDEQLLRSRLIKEIVHELGHLNGLKHCENYECVMHSSTVVEELDTKGEYYCQSCRDLTTKNY